MGIGTREPRWLRVGAVGIHLALALSVTAALATLQAGGWVRMLLIGVALLPLALSLPGLMRSDSATQRWLALALVLYAGLGSVEVIATMSLAAAGWFFCALIELALVVMLSRQAAPRARDERAES